MATQAYDNLACPYYRTNQSMFENWTIYYRIEFHPHGAPPLPPFQTISPHSTIYSIHHLTGSLPTGAFSLINLFTFEIGIKIYFWFEIGTKILLCHVYPFAH